MIDNMSIQNECRTDLSEYSTPLGCRNCFEIYRGFLWRLFFGLFLCLGYFAVKYVHFLIHWTIRRYPGRRNSLLTRAMAVKKHELVGDSRAQLDLATLALYIQTYNNQLSTYLPPPDDLVKQCQDIVKCLARIPVTGVTDDEVCGQLQAVEEFLLRVMNLADRDLRQEILTTVVKKMYSFISDPQSDACPATSVTLIVFEGSDAEEMISMSRWLIHEGGNGPAGAGQRAALSCLYRWTCTWQGTPSLGDWTLAFMKALEENNDFDILMEVTLDNMERLFLSLDTPSPRQNIADVVFHAMSSMRDSVDALDRISPHVRRVLVNLAADSGQWSRQLLQNAVDILTAMMDRLASLHPRLKDKYNNVISCLERHMASRGCRYLTASSWAARCARPPKDTNAPVISASGQSACSSGTTYRHPRRVGLHNLGNTCYMNSIMQALLVTRQLRLLRRNGLHNLRNTWIMNRFMQHLQATNTFFFPRRVLLPRCDGRYNLRNTCLMNRFMDALLVFPCFSRQVVLTMHTMPYWSKVAMLFSKMMHSISNKMSPQELFHLVKPPFFTTENQHDSSEFLGYLLELLMNHEGLSDSAHDYTRPPPDTVRLRSTLPATNETDCNSNDPGATRRSASPRPGSSGLYYTPSMLPQESENQAGASSSKRQSPDHDSHMPATKRARQERSRSAAPEGPPAALAPAPATAAPPLRQSSFVDSLFGGVLLTRVECSDCHLSSLSRDVFRDLQLAFPEKPEPGRQHSVQSLLEYYCSMERLCGENKYRCPDCRALKDAERSVLIEAPPKYLILVLKNFRFEPKLQVQTKLMHTMIYNQTVTLPTVRSQAEHSSYELYATVIHSGTTLDSGHYYTLAKDNDQWHMYNDDVVSASKEADINTLTNCCTPYILFYRRGDIDEGTVPPLHELSVELQDLVMVHNKHFIESVRKLRMHRP